MRVLAYKADPSSGMVETGELLNGNTKMFERTMESAATSTLTTTTTVSTISSMNGIEDDYEVLEKIFNRNIDDLLFLGNNNYDYTTPSRETKQKYALQTHPEETRSEEIGRSVCNCDQITDGGSSLQNCRSKVEGSDFWRDLLLCNTTYDYVCAKLNEIFEREKMKAENSTGKVFSIFNLKIFTQFVFDIFISFFFSLTRSEIYRRDGNCG